jgi:hypothetical protein
MAGDFTPEQKRYLKGFMSGLAAIRSTRGAGNSAMAAAGETSLGFTRRHEVEVLKAMIAGEAVG